MLKDERRAMRGSIIHAAPWAPPDISEFVTEINGILNDSVFLPFAVVINLLSLWFTNYIFRCIPFQTYSLLGVQFITEFNSDIFYVQSLNEYTYADII